jgi:hypothetical protein
MNEKIKEWIAILEDSDKNSDSDLYNRFKEYSLSLSDMERVYFFRKLKHISVERMAEKRAVVPIENDNIAVFLKRFLKEEPELSERMATIIKKEMGFLPIEKEE